MKYLIISIFILISKLVISQDSLTINYNNVPNQNYYQLTELLPNAKNNNFWEFLFDLAIIESNGNWLAINGQYIGLWQMGKLSRIESIYYGNNYFNDYTLYNFTKNDFIKNPYIFNMKIQKKYICYYIISIQNIMSDYILKYNNKIINNIKITKSGIIASSHLVGVNNVKKYLDSNGKFIPTDGNNVSLERYMILFNDYNF
jgi:hypothetical protein